MPTKSYAGRCHCGAVRFRFDAEEIESGHRCNCSICIRKGSVISDYVPATSFVVEGEASLRLYRFGDGDVQHFFCGTCGISPFTRIASLPAGYGGQAKVGDRRVNLGCVEGLDPLTLEIGIIDGRSL